MARMLWDQIDAKPAACVEDYERVQQDNLKKTLY
jgi:hypothetical protein